MGEAGERKLARGTCTIKTLDENGEWEGQIPKVRGD